MNISWLKQFRLAPESNSAISLNTFVLLFSCTKIEGILFTSDLLLFDNSAITC